MKKVYSLLIIIAIIILSSCSKDSSIDSYSGADFGDDGGDSTGYAGLITAGEWNDLDNWDFWDDLLAMKDYSLKSEYLDFYTNNRVSVLLKDNSGLAVCNVQIDLKFKNDIVWTAKTDNFGKAELWVGLFDKQTSIDTKDLTLFANNIQISTAVKLYKDGVNELVTSPQACGKKVQLSFIVDATGSMGDEIEFLKKDLKDVIMDVENNNPALDIYTSTVFYRDIGDAYVVKHSSFTDNISSTISYINNQKSAGGGDFPEAVHTGLNEAINKLDWSDQAYTRIAFLLLDAPPHYDPQIISEIHELIKESSKKGIKIIPISASGIDKDTEFLLRFFSISTNGTYVFITNHSGIGNDHIEPTVGSYEVEFLNELMIRLINKYTE
ncbi:MAG: VWA domain-containing protein [Bacteroidetes bacterium]|nr:VWA domain-containing protein [Bacteroidota bacterium]